MKYIVFILLSIFFIIPEAQAAAVNVLPDTNSKSGFTRKLGAFGLWQDDNTKDKKINLSGQFSFTYRESINTVYIIFDGEYEEERGKRTGENIIWNIRFRRFLVNRVYFETFTQYESDVFRFLFVRSMLGAGLGFVAIDSDTIDIYVGSAFMNEYIEYTNRDIKSEFNKRLFTYIQANLVLPSGANVGLIGLSQSKLENMMDNIFMISPFITLDVYSNLKLQLYGFANYDSKPPPKIKKLETGIKTGFLIEF